MEIEIVLIWKVNLCCVVVTAPDKKNTIQGNIKLDEWLLRLVGKKMKQVR